MNLQDIKIKPPMFRIQGSRRKLNEYEVRACQLLVASGELAPFTLINEDGQRLLTDEQGRFDGRIKDFDLGGELALCLHRVQRYKERGLSERSSVIIHEALNR